MRAGSMIKPVAMVATGGLLVAAAVAGTRAAGGLEFELRPLVSVPGDDVEVVLLAAAVLCVPLLIVSMFLRRRAQRESEGDEFGWLRRLVLLAVLVASVLVLRELLPALDEDAGTSDTESADTGTGPAEVIFSGWTAVLAAILAMSALAMLWWRRRVEPAAGPQATGGEDNDRAAARKPVGSPSTGNGTTRALPSWDVMPPWRTCSRQPAVLGVARRPPRNCSIAPSPKVTWRQVPAGRSPSCS